MPKFKAAKVQDGQGVWWRAEHQGVDVVSSCTHKHVSAEDAERCATWMSGGEWQDENHTFMPAEQQLSVRFDCCSVPGRAGPLAHLEAS